MNGTYYGTLDEAIFAAFMSGRMFVASASISGASPTIAAGSFLNVVMTNPQNSGVQMIIIERRLDNGVAYNGSPLQYGGISQPAAISTPTVSLNPTSLGNGRSAALCNFAASVSTARLNNAAGTAVPTATGFLDAGGRETKLMMPRMVLPGETFGNFIIGQASGLGSIMANLTAYWLEMPI